MIRCAKNGVKSHVAAITITDQPHVMRVAFFTPSFTLSILGIVIVFRNALQGVGDKITPIASSIIELLGKFAVAMILAPRMGYFGIMISEPLVWAGMAVMLGIGFAANKTFRKENIPNTAEQT